MKYRKKPIEIEAIQFVQDEDGSIDSVLEFCPWINIVIRSRTGGDMVGIIRTLKGDVKVYDGDYIVKGVQGDFYGCSQGIFEETYEIVE